MRRLFVIALLLSAASAFAATTASDLDTRLRNLNLLMAEVFEYRLQRSPEFASTIGDKRWNDQLGDRSLDAIQRDAKKSREFLARAKAIADAGFTDQEKINRRVLVQQLEDALEDHRLKNYEMPINQLQGIYLQIPQLVPLLQFASEKDYRDWTARLHQVPRAFQQTTDLMVLGMRDKLMPARFLLEKAASQIEGIATQKPEETPFAIPLQKFPASISAETQTALRDELLAAIRDDVLPAYAKFGRFVRDEYAPQGRADAGIWALPNGKERYASAVRRLTTTNLTPERIHQIGLEEVARNEGEMLAIAKKLGFDSIKALNESIEKNDALRAKSREDILEHYRMYTDRMYEKLPQLFNRLPKAKMIVASVESFREKSAPGAQYQRGTKDGSRPGRVVVNTSEPTSRKLLSVEATAYHEGVPGHHMQGTIAQELPDLPAIRQHGGFTAFGEGWALYAERLGKEVGLYEDPYSDYGRLQSDIFRAIRLVVDTGLHSKKWTRDQVVQYFRDHSASDEIAIQIETDRYIAWPGQALAYKVGQMKILELRALAEKSPNFDIRAFHDEVIGAGSLPLDVLESRIVAWIALSSRQ